MYARSNAFWKVVAESWGFTIGPYTFIGAFILLLFAWLIRLRLTEGYWTWAIPALKDVDLSRGLAPELLPSPGPRTLWIRALRGFLEAL
jgi:hypothetical protein